MMLLQFLILVVGFILLIKGGDWLVEGSSKLARMLKVSEIVVGLTIVAFGTSAPELVVNLFASYYGHNDIVVGNVVGSNNFNLYVILGLSGIVTPLVVQKNTIFKEIPYSFLAILLLFVFANELWLSNTKTINRLEGLILLIFFVAFIYYVYRYLVSNKEETETKTDEKFNKYKIWLSIVFGLVSLIVGGRLVVNSSVEIAHFFGVSQKIIALTIISGGTSLPELVTSVVAAIKKKNDIAVGNVVGSNIFNVFLVLGLSVLVSPVQFNTSYNFDMLLVLIGTSLIFLSMFTGKKNVIDRWEAALIFLFYVGYITGLIYNLF